MIQQLLERWKTEFGSPGGSLVARAPGRVNLIGEHTDYNEGFVLPCAIEKAVWIMGRRRDDKTVRLVSLNYNEICESDIDRLVPQEDRPWSDYLLGVTNVLSNEGFEVGGWDGVVAGDVPLGAGLSSSAALEVATTVLLREMFGLDLDNRRLALLAQKAENTYVGVQCGIMDQFASTFGEVDHVLFLDCRTQEPKQIPAKLGSAAIVICDTKVERGLVDSEYNTRRSQCEEGVRILREHRSKDIRALRDATIEDLESCRDVMPDAVYRRCRHIVTENPRVLETIDALQIGDLKRIGELMLDSHRSLKDDYEVSCRELDLLVDLAMGSPGVYGSRMTGAGFGGCTVSIVEKADLPEFRNSVVEAYREKTGLIPEITVTRPGPGAAVVETF